MNETAGDLGQPAAATVLRAFKLSSLPLAHFPLPFTCCLLLLLLQQALLFLGWLSLTT